jgi:hypothetical protein
MTVTFHDFEPADVVAIDLQPSQTGRLGMYEPVRDLQHGFDLKEMGPAWTARDGDGRILMCAGVGHVFPDRQGTAWALISDHFRARRRSAGKVLAFGRAMLDAMPFRRIEALARADSPRECGFLEAMDFERCAVMRAWGPLSEDYVLYERVK